MRSHNDDQFIIRPIQRFALKKLSQDRNVANARYFLKLLCYTIVEETGDRKALPVSQIHFGLNAIRRERGNQESLNGERIGEIQRADFRLYLQMDEAIRRKRGSEVKAYTVIFELNGDRTRSPAGYTLQNRIRELASCQETGFFPRLR